MPLTITPALSEQHYRYLHYYTRHDHGILRDINLDYTEDSVREEVMLPRGESGEFLIGYPINPPLEALEQEILTPTRISPVIAYQGQFKLNMVPGPTTDCPTTENVEDWLNHIINTFLVRWFYQVNGQIKFVTGDQRYWLKADRNRVWVEKIVQANPEPEWWTTTDWGTSSGTTGNTITWTTATNFTANDTWITYDTNTTGT